MYVSDDIYPFFILTYYYIEGVYIITYILEEFIDGNLETCDAIRIYELSVRHRPWNNTI